MILVTYSPWGGWLRASRWMPRENYDSCSNLKALARCSAQASRYYQSITIKSLSSLQHIMIAHKSSEGNQKKIYFHANSIASHAICRHCRLHVPDAHGWLLRGDAGQPVQLWWWQGLSLVAAPSQKKNHVLFPNQWRPRGTENIPAVYTISIPLKIDTLFAGNWCV